eukprot:scaffold34665_cov158-Amphora_coffeaeformis.AAC.3
MEFAIVFRRHTKDVAFDPHRTPPRTGPVSYRRPSNAWLRTPRILGCWIVVRRVRRLRDRRESFQHP